MNEMRLIKNYIDLMFLRANTGKLKLIQKKLGFVKDIKHRNTYEHIS